MSDTDTQAMEFRPPWRWKLGRWLFPYGKPVWSEMDRHEWAKDCITMKTWVVLPWVDRLRLLVSGRMTMRHAIYCQDEPGRTLSENSVHIEMPRLLDVYDEVRRG